jgi:DeoR/GlpR family transcriptional regulator of sugar metabolism
VLASQGVLERFRGGARSILPRGEELPLAVRAQEGVEVERRLAAEIAALIGDGESVVLDSGTTCLEVASVARAASDRDAPVIAAVNVLADAEWPGTVLVPGGRRRPGEGALTGPLTRASREDTLVAGPARPRSRGRAGVTAALSRGRCCLK